MRFKGRGAYPYECRCKDTHPNALIWQGCSEGHTGWLATDEHGRKL